MQSFVPIFSLLLFFTVLEAQIPPHPFAPASSWPEGHGTYAQQNSPLPGPTELDSIVVDTINLPEGFTGFFPTGTITTELNPLTNTYNYWGTNGKAIYKVVCLQDSTVVISELGSALGGNNFVSGYWLMDEAERGYFLSDYKLLVLEDDPLDPYSPIANAAVLDLSTYQIPDVNDDLWAVKLLYSGELVITSSRGNIFVVDRNTLDVLDHVLLAGDSLINSMVVDEGNHVFINTKQELIKFRWRDGALSETWKVTLGESGSTPSLVGGAQQRPEERLIAVTDKSNVMNLVLLYRDSIPADWAGLPNYPRRVAAVAPIDFNVEFPAFNVRPTQNSILVEGHSFLLARWDNLFPTANAFKPGLEKWTWDPVARRLVQDWVNEEVYLPNSMQALSTSTGYVYAIGQTQRSSGEKYWCLKGVDWDSGEERLSIDLGPHGDTRFNTKGSGIQIGPFGDVITMSPELILRFRKFDPIVGVGAEAESPLKLFPNPSAGPLFLDVGEAVFDVVVFDVRGRRVWGKDRVLYHCWIDTEGWSRGTYLLRVRLVRSGEWITRTVVRH